MAVPIIDLSTERFTNRPFQQQLQIVASGRPLPKNMSSQSSTSNKIPTPITPQLFQRVQWLAYSESLKDFVCWPCLLFMPHVRFAVLGIRNPITLNDILEVTNKHEITEDHLKCSLNLRMFISENFRSSVSTLNKVGHNYAVNKNREMLKCIIDAVCCMVGQKRLDGDRKYSFNLISIKDCKNFLQLLKDYYPRKVEVVDGAVDLLNSNPRLVNILVDAMTRSLKTSIKNEIIKASYVSVIFSEHGSNRVKSQMSTVLRYIHRGKVCERFNGFTNYVGIQTRDQLAQCVLKPLNEYAFAKRFLGLSLDGKVLYGQSLSLFITSLSINYRFTYFVPWYSHGFGCVLLQTLSVYEECGFFLKMISGIQDFFRNEKHFKSLEALLRQKITNYSGSPGVKWNLYSNFVVYVAAYRCFLIEFFGNIICNSRCQENGIVAQAMAFRSFLLEFRNAFLLRLFYEIFHCEFFDETFNFRLDRNAFNGKRISLFQTKVNQISLSTILGALEADVEALKSKQLFRSEMSKIESLFTNLIRHFNYEIDARCTHLSSRLSFCDLFDALRDCPSDAEFSFNQNFNLLRRQMMKELAGFFSQPDLRVEMNSIKSNPFLRTKTVYELLEYFVEHNLRSLFPESCRLLEFILTLPYLPASRQSGGVSKLEDIRKFSYFPESNGIPSGEVSVLSIESEMLRSLRRSPSFHEDVLARFREVCKALPLEQV